MLGIAWIVWDPPRELFTVPWIDRPVGWYGLFFAFGMFIGYLLMVQFFSRKIHQRDDTLSARSLAFKMTDTLCWFAVIGIVVGARLGHVFLYGWPYFSQHPTEIIRVWEGGLASHGGIIGLFIALALYLPRAHRYLPTLTYLGLVDFIAIAALFTAFCIRMGNFFNQEIVGTPTTVPWGVVFGHPLDGVQGVPLHPVQLYEGGFYLILFCCLYRLWLVRGDSIPTGAFTGYVLTLAFGWRILFESVKSSQGGFLEGWLQTGQLLSIPFLLIGLFLLWKSRLQLIRIRVRRYLKLLGRRVG